MWTFKPCILSYGKLARVRCAYGAIEVIVLTKESTKEMTALVRYQNMLKSERSRKNKRAPSSKPSYSYPSHSMGHVTEGPHCYMCQNRLPQSQRDLYTPATSVLVPTRVSGRVTITQHPLWTKSSCVLLS